MLKMKSLLLVYLAAMVGKVHLPLTVVLEVKVVTAQVKAAVAVLVLVMVLVVAAQQIVI